MLNIVWFRQDLRLVDNPALSHAASRGRVLPLFIVDETLQPAGRPLGGAARWWLHHSLAALERSVGRLVLLRGKPENLLVELAKAVKATGVYWNRCYEPYAIARDEGIKEALAADGLDVASFNASLLYEPWQLRTGGGRPYKVYTPFWKAACKAAVEPPTPRPELDVANIDAAGSDVASVDVAGSTLDQLDLLPKRPNWATGFEPVWRPGEAGAHARLTRFLDGGLRDYATLRDRPDRESVSRLSPHLHWGEISPRQVWAATKAKIQEVPALSRDAEKFLAELGWREFAYHLLYHFPSIAQRNLRTEFDVYPWVNDTRQLSQWQRGMTGYPIVDAGMRELWTTGYMHNRVRMIAASFLVKHLRCDWRAGEAWFWDTLVDADLASNTASWQWVAGSGADAAPYFRVFNPVAQGRKFDPDGVYVRRWCPELSRLPNALVHAPFEADPDVLSAAGVELGSTYPLPIVDHAAARAAALAGYEVVKTSGRAHEQVDDAG